ncbi:MAG: chromosome segregation protein SMC [Elainellaceae cyanobacterium]
MYIKRVELSHFKSFGGTTQIPLRDGFTVISGPNGSGKSNILDALLFALGLSTSKGMRAEKLPDLVNQNHSSRSRTMEASVSVTLALGDLDELDDDLEEASGLDSATGGNDSHKGNGSEANGSEAKGPDSNGHSLGKPSLGEPLAGADLNGASNGAADHGTPSSAAQEWTVTRKLRVTAQGTYTSTYFINGESCTLSQLHEQMQRLRVYPEGYNVVLQGDVTSIISMNPRERREIIDELAGVAAFDRKIGQAKEKLDAVHEREERFRIVEKELTAQRDRLAKDRIKAEKYQQLRQDLQTRSRWEAVLVWRNQQRRITQCEKAIATAEQKMADLREQQRQLRDDIQRKTVELEQLNAKVKALGEEEQLALQSNLATQEAERRQLQRQEQAEHQSAQEAERLMEQTRQEMQSLIDTQVALQQEQQDISQRLIDLTAQRDQAQRSLGQKREDANAVAAASESWVQQQAELRHRIDALLAEVDPLRTEQARLQERIRQLTQTIETQTAADQEAEQALAQAQAQQQTLGSPDSAVARVQTLAAALAATRQELQLQQETQARLLREQRDSQRKLDKLEAQAQATQESQGTYATQILIQTGLPGVCGLVAQLGQVDSRYQLALETSAGGRLGHLVVEDDGAAAAGIRLLKERRGGRATFLPLNKIRAPRLTAISKWKSPAGFIDYAVNLVDCDDRYRDIFGYVFGNTLVFESLAEARQNIGQYRMVTLEGELLEASGAMTGGSTGRRQGSLHFGTAEASESAEARALRQRLSDIERVLDRCEGAIAQLTVQSQTQADELTQARDTQRDTQLSVSQVEQQVKSLTQQQQQVQQQLGQNRQELETAQGRLEKLQDQLPAQETQLQALRDTLSELEASQTHSEWQQAQQRIQQQESVLNDCRLALRTAENRAQDLNAQQQRLQERSENGDRRLQEHKQQQRQALTQQAEARRKREGLDREIAQLQKAIAQLDKTLAAEKQTRDRVERQLREQQSTRQTLDWQLEKLQEERQAAAATLVELRQQLEEQAAELPDPIPELPADLTLTQLQQELRSLQKRIQAMEPVNMMALEEHKRTQERLEDLSEKLSTLAEERSELLLRIENFTTLRQRAFKEAFDAVNTNFQVIFAELSDGDGHLQLDNPSDPFSGGLTLVAHPKGKPVRRLASMSGGEKSLTALSFIFALQRYRPSPFYAFDEVDMFLDGANVERLAKMIKHQSQYAQFVVVSLRRPMIESAERTIGVTQARGAYTQVLGINLQSQRA